MGCQVSIIPLETIGRVSVRQADNKSCEFKEETQFIAPVAPEDTFSALRRLQLKLKIVFSQVNHVLSGLNRQIGIS